jgi:ABC-type multidrug transport system fused ATPase/permease subunit
MPVIKAFGLEKWTQNRFTNGSQSLLTSAINMMNWNSLIRPMTVLLCGLPLVVILWWGGHLVTVGALEIGLLVTYIRYSERFMGPIRTISQEIQHIQEALVSSERVRQMLSEEVENDVLGDDGQLALPIEGQIKFEDVCMEYIKGKPILNGVSFEIAAGETVAFVGATGSGKTTTVNLIPKLYPISSGEITLDGYDLRDWSRKGIRKNLGYVGQDVVIFRGTIRENLLAAVDDSIELSDQKILAACERTGLSSIIERFKDGLDYNILEAGKNLSMGERQLIAFTRMLLKDPAILILDEATANIDEHCEKLIQKAVSELMEHRTCIVIAHRLSTILHADQILVFKDGRVVEKGCHEDLVAHNGIYAELIRRQIDGHLD